MIGRGRDFAVYGLTLRDWPRSLRWALLSALIVLPLYAFGHVLWQKHFGHAPHLHLGRALIVVFFRHLLVVALPEELFFRGYVQTLLGQRLHRTAPRWLGERWPAIVATSLLFALAHLAVDGQPARLAVFFPALLFGWLRERTGSLLAPVLVHTLANLTVFILAGSV
ncbi:MAG TPA: myxosortase family intramembrane protease [bacterium]|nr:myxosortase family intramembrane protease [bacterium]